MRLMFVLLWRQQHMTCDLVRNCFERRPVRSPRTTLRTGSNIGLQDRPCARCVKRSIGHLCHDEPRDSSKGVKHDKVNTTSTSGTAAKQEDSLPYMLGPSIDVQQPNQQALEDAGAYITTSAAAENQTNITEFLPQSSNPLAQGQGQVFGEKNQQCEKHIKFFYPMTMSTDGTSS